MTSADWVWQHLQETGVVGPDRIGRAAKASACHRCNVATVTGLDNDLCAGVAVADPNPLNPIGEALALLAGRSTYALQRTGGRYELRLRDPWQIAGRPAGTGTADVVASHTCFAPPLPGTDSVYQRRLPVQYDYPPF